MKILPMVMFLFVFIAPLRAESSPVPRPPKADGASATGSLERLLAKRPVINRTLTIEEAVAVALRESPLVRGAVEEVEVSIGRLNAARAERRPWLSANTFLSGGTNPNTIESPGASQPQMIMGLPRGGFVDANLMLMYPLYTGGRLSAMVRQAAALRNASEAELAAQQEDVALMTRTAYREVLARRALVQVWKARLKEDQERLRIDRARFAQERIPSFYVQRDEAEAAATQQELTNAERDAALSLVQLRTVMGVHPASRIEVVGPLEYQPSSKVIAQMTAGAVGGSSQESGAATELPADLAALLSLAERERPELRSARERVQSAQAESAVARSAFRPQVNLFGMSDLMKMKGEDSSAGVTYGVVASFPLYNGGQQRARLQTAEAERRRQEQEEERVALQVAQEVTSALLNLRAAEQNIQTAQAALTAAQEESRVARLRYEVGRSVVVEALDALAARVRAEANVVQALFQYNVAGDQLKRAVGGSSMASSFGLTSSGSDG